MNEDFIRPAINAVTSPEQLTVGTKLWHVYGIWSPFMDVGPSTVQIAPVKYSDHPEGDPSRLLSNSMVFSVSRQLSDGRTHTDLQFLSDGNIGDHYNNNYWFLSREDAESFVQQCTADWKSRPDAIKETIERRRADVLEYLNDE